MTDPLICVEGVSKKFCRSLRKSLWYGMRDLGRELTGRRGGSGGNLRPAEFWAVKDVSFELRRGECLGLIGRNGAGKTTLLRMLNGLIKPDTGRIEMRGRVGALIALGAGFNPVLTGRENIYVNASVLGFTKRETHARLEEIVEFAELTEFIDSPVQTYSSGMHMRLGFAIASALKPDILLLDEVLAVGDVAFRMKCYNRMQEAVRSGVAAIFVSHNAIDLQRICTRGAHLEAGTIVKIGAMDEAMYSYDMAVINREVQPARPEQRGGGLRLSLEQVPTAAARVNTFDDVHYRCVIDAPRGVARGRMNVHIASPLGPLTSASSLLQLGEIDLRPGVHHLELTLSRLALLKGVYSVWVDMYGVGLDEYLGGSNRTNLMVDTLFHDTFGFGACHVYMPTLHWRIADTDSIKTERSVTDVFL